MVFNSEAIEKYKNDVIKEFMIKSVTQLKEEFSTDRICWAFIMWTYKKLNIFIDTEDRLRVLVKEFKRVQNPPYKFPDIILFKSGEQNYMLGRHAGIMLNSREFVHMGRLCNGIQFTHLDRLPWRESEKVIIRNKNIETNNS